MAGSKPIRPRRRTFDLDLAEQKSWQNYLTTVLRMSTQINRQLSDAHDLSLNDIQLLELLDNSAEGSIQMGGLAEALMSLPSRLTRQVRRLEEQGLVQRRVNPQDRRRVSAIITDEGRNTLDEAMITYADTVRTHFLGPLTRPQIAAMADSCQQIGSTLQSSE